MQCCVPFCKNTTDNVSTAKGKGTGGKPEITFYGFPSQTHLRAAWLKALGQQDPPLPDSAVVCSKHFLDDESYERSGLRHIYTRAIPSTVQVCLICLDTESKLFLIKKHKLKEAYENLTGYSLLDPGNLKQAVCVICAQKLRNFKRFKDQSLRTRLFMIGFLEQNELITKQHIEMIKNACKNKLKCNLVRTMLGPNHYDSCVVELDNNKHIMIDKTFTNIHRDDEIVVATNEPELDENTQIVTEKTIHRVDEIVIEKNKPELDENTQIMNEKTIHRDEENTQTMTEKTIHRDDEIVLVKNEPELDENTQIMNEKTIHRDDENTQIMTDKTIHRNDEIVLVKNEPELDENTQIMTEKTTHRDDEINVVRNETRHDETKNIHFSDDVMVIVKTEVDESVAVDEEMEDIYAADNLADNFHDDVVASKEKDSISDHSIMLDSKIVDDDLCKALQRKSAAVTSMVKGQTAGTPVPVTVESSNHQDKYNKYMNLQSDDSDDECGTLQICWPPDSPSYDSSNMTDQKELQKLDGDPPADSAHTVVSTSSARVAASNICGELNNQSDSNSKINTITNCDSDTRTGWLNDAQKYINACHTTTAGVDHNVVSVPQNKNQTPEAIQKDCTNVINTQINNSSGVRTADNEWMCVDVTQDTYKRRKASQKQINDTEDKPYPCTFCDYKCKNKYYLKLHVRTHTGEKPFSCTFCDYKCARSTVLAVHMRRHTGEKPYSCKLCAKKFTNYSNWMSHMRTHSGERPVSCTLCDYKCVDSGGLLSHMKTHTGEKPYYCNLCQYRCSHKNHLVLHMRIHTGEKPYDCNYCDYKTARGSDC